MKRAHCPAVTATQAPPPNGKNVRTLRLAGPAAKAPPRRACGRRGRRGGCGTYLRLVKLLFSVCDFVSNDGPNVFDDHGVLLDVPSSIQAQSLGGNVRARAPVTRTPRLLGQQTCALTQTARRKPRGSFTWTQVTFPVE